VIIAAAVPGSPDATFYAKSAVLPSGHSLMRAWSQRAANEAATRRPGISYAKIAALPSGHRIARNEQSVTRRVQAADIRRAEEACE
jgi:hypothetical protein